MEKPITCVVTPAQSEFLDVLSKHSGNFKTFIWPGYGQSARRMSGPYKLFPKQIAVPFLFRSIGGGESGPPYSVTHVGLAVYMVHDELYYNLSALQEKLRKLRVERSVSEWSDDDVRTWYVVTCGIYLHKKSIPFRSLHLLSKHRPLSPTFARGYAMVILPKPLWNWYNRSTKNLNGLLDFSPNERWKYIQI